MNPNVVSILWMVIAFFAGILLSLGFNFLSKKNNSARNNVSGNGNHTAPVASATPASSVRTFGQNYEVFLNFRGTDTRKTFTDNLYHRLVDVRVCVFRDNEELRVGEEIHPNLLAAIQSSKISIPIFSPDYASSKWCLLELAQIVKCRENQIILPIFYHVNPRDVRHQEGSFGKAFSLHEKNYNSETVQEWKDALKIVASFKGFELKNDVDGYEGKLVNQVVEKVLTDLRKTFMAVPEILVGVEEQAREIMERVKASNDVQVVLIHGMGGIGKTTLAKFLFNQLCSHFQFRSFLEIGRETPIQQLQMQLISETLKKKWPWDIYHPDEGTGIINDTFEGAKVLLVFDDVDNGDRLDALMGRHNRFGQGSIIIITSRDRGVLKPWHAKLIHEMRELDFNQSFQLFRAHAFQREDSNEVETIARDIVSTTGGLPLAIVVIGSFLWGKNMDIWKETLKKLERVPDDKVQTKLKISYDALNDAQKKIFLDIACLSPSKQEFQNFMYMWEDCEYYPRSGIEALKSLSLIKVGSINELIMHDQLRQLGREIVKQQGTDLPGKRSILWNPKEARGVLERDQGTEQIEVLNLASDKKYEGNCFTSEQFRRLTKLRFLRMNNANLVGNFKNCLLNLRWLQWYGCPSSFRATGFRPINLVVLNLSRSNITEHWGGWREMKYAENLKVLQLNSCYDLKATPDFSTFKQLDTLDLSYCKRLRRIHPSIGRFTKTLECFCLDRCEELGELPIEVARMEKLRGFSLRETSIREIPVAEGYMTKLESLDVAHCKKLARLPGSIGSLTNLECLRMYGCISLTVIPESIGKLKSLSQLDLRHTNIKELPGSIGNLHKLDRLWICSTPIKRLPATCGMLENLQSLDARDLHGLTDVPKDLRKLTRLDSLSLDRNPISELPNLPHGLADLRFSGRSLDSLPNLSYLTDLRNLHLSSMDAIPELPSSLWSLSFESCQTLRTLPSFSYLKYLRDLVIADCTELTDISSLEEVQSLRELRIRNCKISKLCRMGNGLRTLSLNSCNGLKGRLDLSNLKYLSNFSVTECNNIDEIQGLDTMEWVVNLCIYDCSSLERIGDLSHLTKLRTLGFGSCPKLKDIDYPCIDKFTSLKMLRLHGGSPSLKFPDLPLLKRLKWLDVIHFEQMREIPNLQEMKSLEMLSIRGCKSLEKLPDFSEFTNLWELDVQGCEKLKELRGLENFNSFVGLRIFGCRSLKQLPKLWEGRIYKEKSGPRWSANFG